MSEARHQAEQMQKHLKDLAACETELRTALDGGGLSYDAAGLTARIVSLNAHIRVRAETLARAVLKEIAP